MTEEIKKIEQYLKKCSNCFTCNNFLGEDENGGHCMLQNAYNYITNLQKENEELKQSKLLNIEFQDMEQRLEDYKSRNEKAIEYIENDMPYLEEPDDDYENNHKMQEYDKTILLNILQSGDE